MFNKYTEAKKKPTEVGMTYIQKILGCGATRDRLQLERKGRLISNNQKKKVNIY